MRFHDLNWERFRLTSWERTRSLFWSVIYVIMKGGENHREMFNVYNTMESETLPRCESQILILKPYVRISRLLNIFHFDSW